MNIEESRVNVFLRLRQLLMGLVSFVMLLLVQPVFANGEIGDHVNHLSDNIENYTKEVNWLNSEVDDMVNRYQAKGVKAANTQLLIDNWEAVDFHSAIETNYVPVYASIWQGIFGLKKAIEGKAALTAIQGQQQLLKESLWQALGAVKLAAQFQERGLVDPIRTTEGSPANSLEAIKMIENKLNRVVAKYAEQLPKKAVKIVHDTYMNLFEGIEGELIALDAELVEDLEKDFNVTLPQSIQTGDSVDQVRTVINTMQSKLDNAYGLLEKSAAKKKDVF